MPQGFPIAVTFAILLASAALEGVLAGRNPKGFLESLTQPRWAPRFGAWMAIGILFYLAFGTILYRQLRLSGGLSPATILTVAVLLANGGWNYLFFRRRDLPAAYKAMFFYSLLIAALLASLLRQDRLSALILLPYLAYLPFALLWLRTLRRLNPTETAR